MFSIRVHNACKCFILYYLYSLKSLIGFETMYFSGSIHISSLLLDINLSWKRRFGLLYHAMLCWYSICSKFFQMAPKNYRVISLLSHFYELFSRVKYWYLTLPLSPSSSNVRGWKLIISQSEMKLVAPTCVGVAAQRPLCSYRRATDKCRRVARLFATNLQQSKSNTTYVQICAKPSLRKSDLH